MGIKSRIANQGKQQLKSVRLNESLDLMIKSQIYLLNLIYLR